MLKTILRMGLLCSFLSSLAHADNRAFGIKASSTGQCLVASSTNTLQQTPCKADDSAQQWRFVQPKNRPGGLLLVFTQTGQCATATNTSVQLAACATPTSLNQLWQKEFTGETGQETATDAPYRLQSIGTLKCLSVKNLGQADLTQPFMMDNCGVGNNQKFMFTGKQQSCNKNLSVLRYLRTISGKQTIGGVHNKMNQSPAQYTDRIKSIIGKQPTFWSADFGFGESVNSRGKMIDEAIKQWNSGAIIQIMYHACDPRKGGTIAAETSCFWGAGGGVVQTHLSDTEWNDLITEGGRLNANWKQRLDNLAVHLKRLQSLGAEVLFRPIHEMNQGAFWWGGRTGPQGTSRLFEITRDYLEKKHNLKNLIWVWDVQDLSFDFAAYKPKSAYWDIAALDFYNGDGYTTAKYDAISKVSENKPIAIGETFVLPTPAELAAQKNWVFFMAWPDQEFFDKNSDQKIRDVFNSPNVITGPRSQSATGTNGGGCGNGVGGSTETDSQSTPATPIKVSRVAGKTIWLKSSVNNQYVTTWIESPYGLYAKRSEVHQWEKFTVVAAGQGFAALQSAGNNMFVGVRSNGDATVQAISPTITDAEKFKLLKTEDGFLALQSKLNNHYVTARTDVFHSPLQTNVDYIRSQEKFEWGKATPEDTPPASSSGTVSTGSSSSGSISSSSGSSSASCGGQYGGFSTAAPTPGVGLTQDQTQQVAIQLMKNLIGRYSFTPAQAAGILGNLMLESGGLNSNINQGGALGAPNDNFGADVSGYGWAQWTAENKRAFLDFAKQNGLDPASPAANYLMLTHILDTTPNLLPALKATSSAPDAALAFMQVYEQPLGGAGRDGRLDYANQVLQWYISAGQPSC